MFQKAGTLTTREAVYGTRRIGQTVPLKTLQLDKVSLYLEPVISDQSAAESITIIVEAYALDGENPGMLLDTDTILLSDIPGSGTCNFELFATAPADPGAVVITLRTTGATKDNHVAWRYQDGLTSDFASLTSTDGITWVTDNTRAFSYRAYSLIPDAVDSTEQTASVQPGTVETITDDTNAEFSSPVVSLNRTVVTGDTVAIEFPNFVVTLVVDQSGSMTWNDAQGARLDFLKEFIADLNSSLPEGSTVTCSVLKFRGKRIGKLKTRIDGVETANSTFGIQILRDPVGAEVYNGVAERFEDNVLSAGSYYYYYARTYLTTQTDPVVTTFSDVKSDLVRAFSHPAQPFGIADFKTQIVLTDNAGVVLADGDLDIGYRKVLLTWANPSGFDALNSKILLVRRDDRIPETPLDGTILLPSNTSATTTSFEDNFGSTYSFANGLTYYYAIFTYNSNGVRCLPENVKTASVAVPVPERAWELEEDQTPPVGFPTTPPDAPTYEVAIGNGAIQLNWTGTAVRYKIYVRTDRFSNQQNERGTEFDGDLVYDGSGSEFVHRYITNGQPYHYTLIALDNVENASTPIQILLNAEAPKPLSSADFLKPAPVEGFSAETVSGTSALLTWKNPVSPDAEAASFWFGDRVKIEAVVEYIDQGTSETFTTLEFEVTDYELAYRTANTTIDPKTFFQFGSVPTPFADSISAILSVSPSLALQNKIESGVVNINACLRLRNRATNAIIGEVKSNVVKVTFRNPLSLEIVNDPPQEVSIRNWTETGSEIPDPTEVCRNFEYQPNKLNGVYAQTGNPFFATVKAKYKDQPLDTPMTLAIRTLNEDGTVTSFVSLPGSANGVLTIQTSNETDEVLDPTDAPTTSQQDRIEQTESVAPVTIPASDTPGTFILSASGTYNGYVTTATLPVRFQPILNVDLELTPFIPNGTDSKEQRAFVYLAPYDATDIEKTPVPDGTITEWVIQPICKNIPTRKLYSKTEGLEIAGSRLKIPTLGGVASGVFWGPGTNVESLQRYMVTVTVRYNGMVGVGNGILELDVANDNATYRKIFLRNVDRDKFYTESMYADGTITSTWEVLADPTQVESPPDDYTTGPSFAEALGSIGAKYPALPESKLIKLSVDVKKREGTPGSPDDILKNVKVTTNYKSGSRTATAKVVNGKATFQITCNSNIPRPQTDTFPNTGAQITNLAYQYFNVSFDYPDGDAYLILTASTAVEENGLPTAYTGGGGNLTNSMPPAFVSLSEPLFAKRVWAKIGDDVTNILPPDSKTTVDICAEFLFAGDKIPEGTPVYFVAGKGELPEIVSEPKDILDSIQTIDGVSFVDQQAKVARTSVIDEYGQLSPKNIAIAKLNPISALLNDTVDIYAYCTYDALGTATRFAYTKMSIPVAGGSDGLFLNSVEMFNGTEWVEKSPMPTGRAGAVSATVSNKIYAIGGYAGNFLGTCEEYDPATDTWASKNSMPTPTGYGCVATDSGYVYVLGGYSYSPGRTISAVQRYNPSNDTWTTLANMPDGLAFGTAQVVSGAIWVLGGVNKFDDRDNPLTYNDAVYRYSISLDSWTTITPTGGTIKRIAPNSFVNGSGIVFFNGYDGTSNLGDIRSFNTSTNVISSVSGTPNTPRHGAAATVVTGDVFVISGSNDDSDFLDNTETDSSGTWTESANVNWPRTNASAATATVSSVDRAFLLGGQGSGFGKGWLKLSVEADPSLIRADGRTGSSVTISAVDASGDIPPRDVAVKIRGLLFIGTNTSEANSSSPLVSIMPVLFSDTTLTLHNGKASTILLPRSEDQINEVENLIDFVKGDETVLDQASLKLPPPDVKTLHFQMGEIKNLYSIAIEVTVDDVFYFGTSDSVSATTTANEKPLASTSFKFNPENASQGLSARVDFFSDIPSIPDVQKLTSEPVTVSEASDILDNLADEIPFGASPHFDALVAGSNARVDVTESVQNMMVSTCDNENSGSANSADDVVDAANAVAGVQNLPVFVTTFVITDPVSLAARKDRTAFADLERISSGTGGNSFSVDSAAYFDFIIDRIKTSAPSSLGSGTITVPHEIDGSISQINFTVANMVAGNAAVLSLEYSLDGYNYTTLDTPIPANAAFNFGTPLRVKHIRYTVKLSTKTLSSPVLSSVAIQYIKPSVQYLFTEPQSVSGQVSEIAMVSNARLPEGCSLKMGIAHGNSVDFERDFDTPFQPAVEGNGVVEAINRASAPIISDSIFRDVLTTDNYVTYLAKAGPWAQKATVMVYADEVIVDADTYILVPEKGMIAFKQRRAPSEAIKIEVQNPATFRVGLRVENPTLSTGVIDAFGYSFGETIRQAGLSPVKPPRATNLQIATPVFIGGTLHGSYVYADPNGYAEDTDKTEINWFKNNVVMPTLRNKLVITSRDLGAKVTSGQQWTFTVRPHNGYVYGPLATSRPITVSNTPPTATNARLKSSNVTPSVFTSSDDISVLFDYTDQDANLAKDTIYTFFVNGISVQSGLSNILRAESQDENGSKLIQAGATVSAEVLPYDGLSYGTAVLTSSVTITSSPPSVSNVQLLPTTPQAGGTLKVFYDFSSPDKLQDRRLIAWYRNGNRVASEDNFDSVPASGLVSLNAGETWKCVVTPYDGAVEGTPVASNSVRVAATA